MSKDDEADFEKFFAATYRRTVAQLFALTGNLGAAEEAAQEGYVRAWSRWAHISKYDDPAAWIYFVARRIAVSQWRHHRRSRLSTEAKFVDGARVPAPSEDTVLLVQGLRRLPVEQREALVLHYLMGWSIEEIASRDGRPIGTIKARLSRGRDALSEAILDKDPPDHVKGVM